MSDNEDPEFLVEILTTNPLASTDRLWVLHKMALDALRQAEKDRNVTINMDEWLVVRAKNKRTMCLAGALLYAHVTFDKTPCSYWPEHFGDYMSNRLEVIEALRCGELDIALDKWDVVLPFMSNRIRRAKLKLALWQTESTPERTCPCYEDFRALWWEYQQVLQRILREEDV